MRIPECPSECPNFIELVEYLLVEAILHWVVKPAEPRDRMQFFYSESLHVIESGSPYFFRNIPESVCSRTERVSFIHH